MAAHRDMTLQELQNLITRVKPIITHGNPPERNCTDWNQDLAIVLREQGVAAEPFGSRSYKMTLRDGTEIHGHIIAVVKLSEHKWAGIDLSSAQIQGLPEDKIWTGNSLKEMGDAIDGDLPGFGTLVGSAPESNFVSAFEKSLQRDRECGRYEMFRY